MAYGKSSCGDHCSYGGNDNRHQAGQAEEPVGPIQCPAQLLANIFNALDSDFRRQILEFIDKAIYLILKPGIQLPIHNPTSKLDNAHGIKIFDVGNDGGCKSKKAVISIGKIDQRCCNRKTLVANGNGAAFGNIKPVYQTLLCPNIASQW